MAAPAAPPRSCLAAVFAASASMLAFEVLLVRLFEFSHWHHFAGLAVSLALLGLGAAGSFLSLLGNRRAARSDGLLLAGLAVQAAGTLAVLQLHALVALRPLFAAWDVRELGRLLMVDFAAFIPFAGAGLVIGQVFMRWPASAASIYTVNLVGAGMGSIAASVLLTITAVALPLVLAALLPAAVLLILALAHGSRRAVVAGLVLCAAGLTAALNPPAPRVSDFKPLSRVQDLPGARQMAQQPGLPGTLSMMRADSLRIAPGLSLQWTEPVPPVDAALVGSDRLVPMPRRFPAARDHTRASLSGLPFQLRPRGRVLIMGASAWQSVVAAGDRDLVWVEPDDRLLRLARERGLSGAGIRLVDEGSYHHLVTGSGEYSIIALDAAFAGGDAATEDYLLTVEGLHAALARLAPDGLLALPLELSVPPRRTPRALTTMREALTRLGAARPGDHVAALRGLQEILLLASPQPLSARDMERIDGFAERWRFDLAWLPDLDPDRTNRFHRLDGPVFHDVARWVFGRGAAPASTQWFDTAPASLDRPYFWRTLKWDRIPDFFHALGRQRALSYLDWTLVLTAVSAAFATVLAAVLILAPVRRLAPVESNRGRASVAGYFTALGLGYMLAELALFQRAILFVGEPVLAAAVVFAVFLVGSGIGASRTPPVPGRSQAVSIFAAIGAGIVLSVVLLWWLDGVILRTPGALRLAAVAAALAPLAWALGRAFPWGLQQLAGHSRTAAWAWAVNGFASVVAAGLASLISVQWGQPATLATAAACYVVAGVIAWRWTGSDIRHHISDVRHPPSDI